MRLWHRKPQKVRPDTAVLDWATLGLSPVGTDVAHLALSTLDPTLINSYRQRTRGQYPSPDVDLGYRYRTTVALVGASRIHWMLSRTIRPPDDYIEFLLDQTPNHWLQSTRMTTGTPHRP